MTSDYPAVSEQEQKAIISLCILSAFADGAQNEVERAEIKRIAETFAGDAPGLAGLYQQALAGQAAPAALAGALQSAGSRALAYEMAVCICESDQDLNPSERKFLADLRQALHLDPVAAADAERVASAARNEPPVIAQHTAAGPDQLDEMIRDRAILAGALELLPQRLATMAIVPVQMRMVYQVGKSFGYDLDWNHTREFFATVGVGLASQVVEGYVSKIAGAFTRRVAGRFLGALASQAAQSVFAFATTYALGQTARRYYQSGRTLSTAQLRDVFSGLLNDGRAMQSRYAGEIAQRAGSLKLADFAPLVKA